MEQKYIEPTNSEDRLVGSLLERGLQQGLVQPQVGRQAVVEHHRLVKQQAEQPEPRAVRQVVRVILVKPPEFLLRVGLSEPEPYGAAMEATLKNKAKSPSTDLETLNFAGTD